MQNATDIALSRLMAQGQVMDVLANNLANANTPGFKAGRVLFGAWLSRQGAGSLPPGDNPINYTEMRATYREDRAGALQQTGNPLDLAITGAGYFTVQTPRGVRVTRAGRFSLLPDGTIADFAGNKLLSDSGQPMQIAPGETGITVAGDGTVSTRNGVLGRIGVVTLNAPNGAKAEGNRLLDPGASGTTPVTSPQLVQGAVEGSNVNPILETTRMMTLLREFQFVTAFEQAESDRMANAIQKITQPA